LCGGRAAEPSAQLQGRAGLRAVRQADGRSPKCTWSVCFLSPRSLQSLYNFQTSIAKIKGSPKGMLPDNFTFYIKGCELMVGLVIIFLTRTASQSFRDQEAIIGFNSSSNARLIILVLSRWRWLERGGKCGHAEERRRGVAVVGSGRRRTRGGALRHLLRGCPTRHAFPAASRIDNHIPGGVSFLLSARLLGALYCDFHKEPKRGV
jgi:hypothetical protein